MRGEAEDEVRAAAAERRRTRPRVRRPWLLIAACCLLAVLAAVLWLKWRETRLRAADLQAELRKVYDETERLRTEAALARQRISQLEQQVRALAAEASRPVPPRSPARR